MTSTDAGDAAQRAAERAVDSDALVNLGRLGWVAKGVVYTIIGVIAVPIAFGDSGSGEEASQSGALAEIAENAWGEVLLTLVGIGLFLYAAWRFVTAVLPAENDAETIAHRVGYAASGALYAFLGWSALSIVFGGGGSSSNGGSGDQSAVEDLTSTLLENTGGRWLLGLVGVGALGLGGYFVLQGYQKDFMKRIDTAGASSSERSLIEKSGMAGYIGRGITVGLIAVFLLQAAWTADPDEARGLDGALRDTADNTWGSALVLVAGVGLVAYGVFAIVSARRRRMMRP